MKTSCPLTLNLLALLFACPLSHHAMAYEQDVTFHGVLIEAPPCVIHNNNVVYVDFGDELLTTRVEGGTYQKPVDFTLDCPAGASTSLQLRISGPGAEFDKTVLDAGPAGLGIAIYHDGIRYKQGDWLSFVYPATPVLHAVLVKQDGVTLSEGSFHAMASLVVDYQ